MSSALKKTVVAALESNDLEAVASLVHQHRKVLSQLVRQSYDKETHVGWRAILAVGMAARELVKTDPESLRDACRKLLWSLNDESGGIGWSAPELLGEIVSSDTKRFADFVPLVAEAYYIEGGMFRAGVMYALARIGAEAPERAAAHQDIIADALVAHDPLVRIRALELVEAVLKGKIQMPLWAEENTSFLRGRILALCKDMGEASIYKGNDFTSIQVGEKASGIIKLF
jgi:hypothetical protein